MFKRLKLKRTKGNILATTIIVGSLAGAVSLSMYAITTSDVKISSQQEDSLLAYQAASAGVDLGLMYYKFNHNVELSNQCHDVNDPANCTDPTSPKITDQPTENLPIRIFIDRLGCTAQGNGDSRDMSIKDANDKIHCAGVEVNDITQWTDVTSNPNQNLPSNERIVDLKIWYKDNKIGDPAKFNVQNSNPTIDQDNSYQIDGLEKVNTFQLHLRPKEWAKERDAFHTSTNPNFNGKWPENYFNKPDPYRAWFQSTFCKQQSVQTNMTDLCSYYVIPVPPQGRNVVIPLRESLNPLYANGYRIALANDTNPLSKGIDSIRIRPINMDAQFAITNVQDILCDPSDPASPHCHLNIDTGITHIEVTGYYGGAKRTLDTQIDRKTNAFLGIFDRALYVGEGDLAP